MTISNASSRVLTVLLLAMAVVSACHRNITPPAQTQASAAPAADTDGGAAESANSQAPVALDNALKQAEVADSKKVTSVVTVAEATKASAADAEEAPDAPGAPDARAVPASVPAALPAAATATATAAVIAEAPSTCVTASCHAKVLSGSTLHPVAEGCDSCHEFNGTKHPTKGQRSFKLTQEMPDLCYTCHDSFGSKKTVHSPVADGLCTMCHDAHSTDRPKLLADSVGETCKTCHAEHSDYKVVHGPVSAGDCTACHSPHESDQAKLLVKSGEQLCFGCHVDMQEVLNKNTVHAALSAGCTSCHNPHGGTFPRMLDAQGPELCFGCHTDIADAVKESTVSHPALDTDAGCAACHSPHASDNAKLLLKPQKEICFECHDTVVAKNVKFEHGPNNDGDCGGCHSPHGSKNAKLLVGGFPTEAYVPYSDNEYSLCFQCHNRDILAFPETSFATNFRNGEKNLHYTHVQDTKKGRSCKLCHSWHGSNNPKLIADTVSFGKWNLPLRFVKTDTGGGCSPGCHKPLYYDRESPGRKPNAPKPAAGADAKKGG